MADQTFNVNCGFFDAVDNDRTYTADQMNLPYKRIVANGVFATQSGTASTDLLVESASNGMNIIVNAGEGIFADKWFNNPSDINITVPSNTALNPRIDSVIVQVDETTSGRVGNIVYRTGTAAADPAVPDINTEENITEYRVANIYVAASANTINNDAITDLRGSSSCPWVTSLIQQVDTSTLWQQFQAAYLNQYNQYTDDYEEYVSEQRQAWEDFLSTLTSELTVTTNVVMFESSYTATATTTSIPINISSFDKGTDILQVFINGLFAEETSKYTVNSAGTSITLVNSIAAGNTVYFVVFKSLISADIQSAVSLIQALDTKVSNFMADSGWINFTLESGASAASSSLTPAVRCVGSRVYLRGAFKGVTTLGSTICTLPVAYRPAMAQYFTTVAMSGTTVQDTVVMEIETDGSIVLYASSGTLSSSSIISLATNFITG